MLAYTPAYYLVGGFNHLEKYNGKDDPMYCGKLKLFETNNQLLFDKFTLQ